MEYEVLQDSTLLINIDELVNDRSWKLVGSSATHYPCSVRDKITLIGYPIEVGVLYTVSFKIKEMHSSAKLEIGFDTALYSYTSPQEVVVEMLSTEQNKTINIWGSGYIELEFFDIKKQTTEPETSSEDTAVWGEANNRWISFRSYRPESGFSMFSNLFTYSRGMLWVHKQEGVRNNFYNKQFTTEIDLPIGVDFVKTFKTIAIHSNVLMATTEDGIRTQLGHVSDLIEDDFETLEGVHYAQFLRDKLDDIISGDRLKGRYIVVNLRMSDGAKKLKLYKVVVKSSVSTVTE